MVCCGVADAVDSCMLVTATVCHSMAELGVVTVTITTVTKTPRQDKCKKEGATPANIPCRHLSYKLMWE